MILAGKRNEKNDKKYMHDLFLNIAGFILFLLLRCYTVAFHFCTICTVWFASSCGCRLYVF